MSDVDVRPAEEGDLSGVLGLLYGGRTEPSEREVTTWGAMISRPDTTVYVAKLAVEVVGTATFLVLENIAYDCRPTAFIEAMRVADEHRRRGIAALILRTMLDDARELGCYEIQLLAHKRHAHDGAHALYKSVGFEEEAAGFRLYLD